MHVGALVKSYLYLLSSSLLYPVLLLLSLLSVWVLVYAGGFLAEWLERSRRTRLPPQELPPRLRDGNVAGLFSHRVRAYSQSLHALLGERGHEDEPVIENLLQASASQHWKSLDRLRMLVRIGPGLGLIGTLIPMGTGLAALGQGDITKLSSDLVIAFTTTVVGLALGMTAYFFHTIKRRWLEEDLRDMEFITEILAHPRSGESKHEVHEEEKANDF